MIVVGDRFGGWTMDVTLPLSARDLRLTLRTGSSRVGIVGPSGAGKSTLLRVLAGVERRALGRLVVDSEVWLDSEAGISLPPWERKVGWVPQEPSLFPHLTVLENLAYSGSPLDRVREVAARLEVEVLLDRRPRRLSGGERQRVALGRALLSAPRLLLLDEPFSALDRPLRVKLAREVRSWSTEHEVPLVLVSHDEEDTEILADERWHLVEGVLELSPSHQPRGSDSPT